MRARVRLHVPMCVCVRLQPRSLNAVLSLLEYTAVSLEGPPVPTGSDVTATTSDVPLQSPLLPSVSNPDPAVPKPTVMAVSGPQ